MTPFIIVLAIGFILHTAVGFITRTPEQDRSPLRWRAWHIFLAGLASGAVTIAAWIGYWAATGTVLPYWALLLAADVLTAVWQLVQHHKRQQERRALQTLFELRSFGESA
jgi:hypothetical protein